MSAWPLLTHSLGWRTAHSSPGLSRGSSVVGGVLRWPSASRSGTPSSLRPQSRSGRRGEFRRALVVSLRPPPPLPPPPPRGRDLAWRRGGGGWLGGRMPRTRYGAAGRNVRGGRESGATARGGGARDGAAGRDVRGGRESGATARRGGAVAGPNRGEATPRRNGETRPHDGGTTGGRRGGATGSRLSLSSSEVTSAPPSLPARPGEPVARQREGARRGGATAKRLGGAWRPEQRRGRAAWRGAAVAPHRGRSERL